MRTRLFFTLLAGTGASLAAEPTNSPPAAIEDPLKDVEVYTPTRGPKKPLDLPYATERITGARVRNEAMAATLPEALLETPGVMVQQTGHGRGSPYLRGFTGFRTLMLVDGIRLNNSTFRDGPNQYWNTVDALAVDRLEILKGPASVLYGSDALGGTVNALMRGPQYGYGEGVKWGGGAYYRFGSAENAHLGRGEFSGSQEERWGVSLGLSGKTFGDVEGGREVGRQPYTGYEQWDIDTKADYWFSPQTKLTVAFQRTQQEDVKRTHRTIYGLNWEGLTPGMELQHALDQLRALAYARFSHETAHGDRFHATLSWQRQDEFQLIERDDRTRQHNGVDVNTIGLAAQGESPSKFGTWTYGAEHYRDYVDSFQRNFSATGALTSAGIQGPVGDDSIYDLFGLFVQNELALLERLHFIVGGRWTWAQAEARKVRDPQTLTQTSFEDDWMNVSGSGRLVWHPDEAKRWNLYTGASQGFRAPNLSDLTRFDIARSGELETAAFGLKPEDFLSVEVGAKTVQKNWEANAAYYYTFIDDFIVRTPTGATNAGAAEVTKRNAGEGWLHGVELSARAYVGEGFSLFGSVAWQEGEVDSFPTSTAQSVRAPISRLHPLTGLAGVRWDSLNLRLPVFAELFGILTARQDRLSPDDERDTQRIPPDSTPGWATLNARAGYDWKGKARLVAAIENLLDEDYRIHGSGYNQAGRNFKLSVEYRF